MSGKNRNNKSLTVVKGFKPEKEKEIKYSHVTEFTKAGKLIISELAQKQIDFLASRFPSTEWSGILIWDVVEGSLKTPGELVVEAKYVFPMDIGTSGYTEYDNDESTMDLYDEFPEAMEMKLGHIHHHHSMTTFFSTTDIDEIHNNSDKYIAYLSLIVNNENKNNAKIGIVTRESIVCHYKDFDDSEATYELETQRLLIYSLEVEPPAEPEEPAIVKVLRNRLSKIRDAVRTSRSAALSNTTYNYQNPVSYADTFSTCYAYIPVPIVESVLMKILTVSDLQFATISSLDQRLEDHPLNFSNIASFVYDRLEEASELITIKDDDILTSMMFNSNFGLFMLARKVMDAVNRFPNGYTKNTTLEIIEELIDMMVYGTTNTEGEENNDNKSGNRGTEDTIPTSINELSAADERIAEFQRELFPDQ